MLKWVTECPHQDLNSKGQVSSNSNTAMEMDSFTNHLYVNIHQSSSQAPSSSTHSSSSLTNFPIIAIAVIGILATAFLLVSYYIIVIKCCLNLHRVSVNQDTENVLMMHSPARLQQPKGGLEQSAINSIPIIEFKKAETELLEPECSVCLGEFQVGEKLRCLQDCSHLFHMDCIDVWLQNNANCPLCRTSISYTNPSTRPPRQDLATAETTTCVDSNFVVIEIQPQQRQLEDPPSRLPRKLEQRDTPKKLKRMKHQMLSMGDECIGVRSVKDDSFKIQPIRRSISMDSSNDPQLYSMVQDVLLRHRRKKSGIVPDNGCASSSIGSSSSRFKRSFISFGSGRSCKGSAVLPTHVDPFI